MKSLFGETKVNIPEAVVDRVHRTGINYLHKSQKKKKKKKNYESIFVRFTTFRHRKMFDRAKKKIK